ncbi:MAG: redoxin domain-containing protein [Chloroflexota bacterium]
MPKPIPKYRSNPIRNAGLAFLIMGLFLIGAAVIFFLADAQENALKSAGVVIAPVNVEYAAPQLALTDLQGNSPSLEDYSGKVILVNNWATWCPPCKAEMPELQVYYATHTDDGFVVIGIESGEPANTVENFVRQNKLSFPVWLDPHGVALEAFQNWNLPNSCVIDREGIVRMSWTGPINQATLDKYITPLLEK